MCAVIAKIWKVTKSNASHTNVSGSKKYDVFRTPIAFVFAFIMVWVSIFGWRFNAEALKPTLATAGQAWITCLLLNHGAGITDPATNPLADTSMLSRYGIANGTGCGLYYPIRITDAAFLYVQIVALFVGGWFFLIYGMKRENFALWGERLKLGYTGVDTTIKSTDDNVTGGKKGKSFMSFLSLGSSNRVDQSMSPRGGTQAQSQIGVMGGAFRSGEFAAVTETQRVAAYMDEPSGKGSTGA